MGDTSTYTDDTLRRMTDRAVCAEANLEASEDNIASLVESLGFENGDGGPMIEDVEERICKLMTLAQRLVRLDDPTDPAGVVDRQTVTLTALIDQAKSALGIQEGGSGE